MTTQNSQGGIIRRKGMKKQIFGGVLLGLGSITASLARVIGFELDIFYVVISAAGACLFLYGSIQKHDVTH